MARIKNNRIGEINYNKYGSKMTIIKYEGRNKILIKFDNGYETEGRYSRFIEGEIENPYDKSVYGVGYLGEGDYINLKAEYNKQYTTWHSMLQRCYDVSYQTTRPRYIGCSVCIEWHNFQVFAEWYDNNIYEVTDQRMELDKDILHKGNKVYSPINCVFVPQFINTLFIKSNAKRGDYPIGVSFDAISHKYMSSGKNAYLGHYSTSLKAFNVYKVYKENKIKETADKYKIPLNLYNAMYNYKVEITD